MFGERLKGLRQEWRLTQEDVAKHLGVSIKTVSFYENGDRNPTQETIIELAKFFQVTTDYLLGTSNVKYVNEDVILQNELYFLKENLNKEESNALIERREIINFTERLNEYREDKERISKKIEKTEKSLAENKKWLARRETEIPKLRALIKEKEALLHEINNSVTGKSVKHNTELQLQNEKAPDGEAYAKKFKEITDGILSTAREVSLESEGMKERIDEWEEAFDKLIENIKIGGWPAYIRTVNALLRTH